MPEVTEAFAAFAARTRLEDIPPALVRQTKLILLDLIGCTLVGGSVDKGRIAVEFARSLGAASEATIPGVAARTSAAGAAFANGELMNALDWDPIPHTLPCVVPAVLAVAERERATGAALLVGLALAQEISVRLAEALPRDLEAAPHGYGSCIFGGAAGAGHVLKLSAGQMANAFGFAGFAAPVPAMTRFEGGAAIPMTKYIPAGWVAQGSVTAALLAALGYTGDPRILDEPQAFWRFFAGDEARWKPERLVEGLGTVWRTAAPWYKPYPCEILIGMAVNRLYQLMRENGLAPDEIEGMEFKSLPLLANGCHTSTNVVSHVEAQFSVPYALAVAALGFEPGPAWQAAGTLSDPGVKRMMERVAVGVHPDAEAWAKGQGSGSAYGVIPCSLVVTARGRRFDADPDEEPGMTEDEIIAKFAKNAAAVLPPAKAAAAQAAILGLEGLADVSTLMDDLRP